MPDRLEESYNHRLLLALEQLRAEAQRSHSSPRMMQAPSVSAAPNASLTHSNPIISI